MATLSPELTSYTLSEAESTQIFHQQIVPGELNQFHGSDTVSRNRVPLVSFIAGQTGAGKTRAASAIKEVIQARRGEPAHFIADTYKTYHPGYSRLLVEKPALASPATGNDARRWLSMAAAFAIERRVDVLVESACRYPEDFAELAQAFHDGGYRVEVVIMAVPEALSRLGIFTRFYERLPEAGSRNLPIRLTPKKVHDDSYHGLVDAVIFIDELPVVDQVVIMRRDNMIAYANERINGKWRDPARGAYNLLLERKRPLSEGERLSVEQDLEKLRKSDVPGLLPQLKEIEDVLDTTLLASDTSILRPLVLPQLHETDSQGKFEVDLSFGLDIS